MIKLRCTQFTEKASIILLSKHEPIKSQFEHIESDRWQIGGI